MKPHQDRFNDFFSNGGDNKHLFNFPLNSLSVIFDVGSFDGEYVNIMHKKYKCKIKLLGAGFCLLRLRRIFRG